MLIFIYTIIYFLSLFFKEAYIVIFRMCVCVCDYFKVKRIHQIYSTVVTLTLGWSFCQTSTTVEHTYRLESSTSDAELSLL